MSATETPTHLAVHPLTGEVFDAAKLEPEQLATVLAECKDLANVAYATSRVLQDRLTQMAHNLEVRAGDQFGRITIKEKRTAGAWFDEGLFKTLDELAEMQVITPLELEECAPVEKVPATEVRKRKGTKINALVKRLMQADPDAAVAIEANRAASTTQFVVEIAAAVDSTATEITGELNS